MPLESQTPVKAAPEAPRRLVSVVIPAYNEQATLPLFYEELRAALAPLEDRVDFELLFINNGSTDGTLELLDGLREKDRRVRVATLSRNFGYQAAITAGLRLSKGDAVGCIDSDGEDPPAVFAEFVETWLGGEADIVYGVRDKRPESIVMRLARKAFYRITRYMADHEIILDMAEFALLDRRVKTAVLSTRSTFPFVRGQVGYVGFRRVGIKYDRHVRLGGKSHYNLVRATQFAVGGILSSSTAPLRVLAYSAGALVPLSLIGLVAAAVHGAATPEFGVLGWSLLGAMLLLVWLVFAVAVVSVYVARVYKDQVALPLYVVDSRRSSLDGTDDEPRS
ncbi:MAG: glycosyltransferase family 2 protein [Labilithrix sp.]|nr:glycosyltransferase family 2 protein [Labilithrix sp.]